MIIPVLLCGGAGTRLWPLSRQSFPKQFTDVVGDESLFQASARRFVGPIRAHVSRAGFAGLVSGRDRRGWRSSPCGQLALLFRRECLVSVPPSLSILARQLARFLEIQPRATLRWPSRTSFRILHSPTDPDQ